MKEPALPFQKVDYRGLNAKQQEVYNYQRIAAILADYGYASYPIRDDWNNGDMIARHMLDGSIMTIQIKGRVTFAEKYRNQGLWVGFPSDDGAYIYPHDTVLAAYLKLREERGLPLADNQAWTRDGMVHWVKPTKELADLLQPYFLAA